MTMKEERQRYPGPAVYGQLVNRVAKGGGIVLIGKIIGKGAKFALQVLLSRVLGTRDYGLYALGFSITSIIGTFSMMGLHSGVVRYGALYRGVGDISRTKGTFLSAIVISTISSIVGSIVLFILAEPISVGLFHKPGLVNIVRAFSFSLPFYVLMVVLQYCARALQRMQYDVSIRDIFQPLSNLALVSLLFLFGFGLSGAVSGFIGSVALSVVLGFFLLQRAFPEILGDFSPSYQVRALLRFSLPVFIIEFLSFLLIQTDKVMLGYFRSAEEVGIYNAAFVVSVQLGLFLVSFNAIFAPLTADLYNRGKIEELDRLYKVTTRWIFSLTFPLFLILSLFSREIMALFGPGFSIGGTALIVLSWGQLIDAGVGSTGTILQMSGKQDIDSLNTVFAFLLNVALNFWFVKAYGILGAALATGISVTLINVARLIEVYKLLKIQPYERKYFKPLISGLAGVTSVLVISRFVRSNWVVLSGILLCVYVTSLLLLGLGDEDKVVLRSVGHRLGIGL